MVASALADEVSWRARAGKLPYLRISPSDSPRSTRNCALCWVPRSRLEIEPELGLACIANPPRHDADRRRNDYEYRRPLVGVNWNRQGAGDQGDAV